MKIRVTLLFTLLWVLLALSRTGDLLYSYSQYRLATNLHRVINLHKPDVAMDEEALARASEYLRATRSTGLEVGGLVGLLALFLMHGRGIRSVPSGDSREPAASVRPPVSASASETP